SDSVRYSRVRTSAFLGRRGVSTFRIWVSGDTIFKAGFVIGFNAPFRLLSVKNAKYGKLQWSFIGQKLDRPRLGRSIVAQLGHDDLAWPSNSSWLNRAAMEKRCPMANPPGAGMCSDVVGTLPSGIFGFRRFAATNCADLSRARRAALGRWWQRGRVGMGWTTPGGHGQGGASTSYKGGSKICMS